MNVYLLIAGVEYEDETICGVLSNQVEAVKWLDRQVVQPRDAYFEVRTFTVDDIEPNGTLIAKKDRTL